MPRSLFEKVWDAHAMVPEQADMPAVLAIDLHLVHEVTSPQAFDVLRSRGLGVRRPDRTIATLDHATPTLRTKGGMPVVDVQAAAQIAALERNCLEFGIPLLGMESGKRGIVHVVGPELGLTQPGMTIVCGDSHTSTHGAFGALAFGIGTTEVGHVLATQTLFQRKPRSKRVTLSGRLPAGVTAKDIILALISRIGVKGAAGAVLEYAGDTIRTLDMEARMTICNMSIEAGARAGLIAPDEVTFDYLADRPGSPSERAWYDALEQWRRLPSDHDATFDAEFDLDVGRLTPMVTYGTNPGMGIGIDGRVPDPASVSNAEERKQLERALGYMALEPGRPLIGTPVQVVFLGSCTNARLSDLRAAASVFRGQRVANGVRALVVPGSKQVKRDAEAEGLDRVFLAAGAEWREPGCSMCIAMNGDQLAPGQYAVSTSNRNFEGRQGSGGRTFLASPLTAAASAIAGTIADPRPLIA